jgi:hypothetical protein
MKRIPAGPGAEQWSGPVLVRGWLRVREPWKRPLAVVKLYRKWLRLKRDVDRGPGFLSFEYWQRFELLLFGMHVGWSSQASLLDFYQTPSHRDIAGFATRSRLVRAMKLETIAVDANGTVLRLGGFVISAEPSDVPDEELFPG